MKYKLWLVLLFFSCNQDNGLKPAEVTPAGVGRKAVEGNIHYPWMFDSSNVYSINPLTPGMSDDSVRYFNSSQLKKGQILLNFGKDI